MTDSRRHPAAHHTIELIKGAAHHVGALLLMTVLRGLLVTAVGASGVMAAHSFLPEELHAVEVTAPAHAPEASAP